MLSIQEMNKRRAAFQKALASLQATGVEFTPADHVLAERYIRGELTINQIIQQILAEDTTASGNQPGNTGGNTADNTADIAANTATGSALGKSGA